MNENINMVDELLIDEYLRYEKNLLIQKKMLSDNYIKGYISQKKIKGRIYYYLQYKEDGRVKSQYIHPKDVEKIKDRINQQNKIKERIKELEIGMKKIEKTVPRRLIDEYRPVGNFGNSVVL